MSIKQSASKVNKNKKTKKRYLIYALILLVLAIAASIAFIIFRNNHQLKPGATAYTLTVDGLQRTYRLYVPASLPAGQVPLVVMLHGALGTGQQAEEDYGWDAKADAEKFVVVYPDGIKRSWSVSSDCCGPPAKDHINDVAFITSVVSDISSKVSIDSSRIYATGTSNGGALAYRMACDTDIFAAIAPVSTDMLGECPAPNPTSVIHIHGADDETFPYSGGPGKRNNAGTGDRPANTTGPSIPDLIAMWREVDSCKPPTDTISEQVRTSQSSCAEGRDVTLVTIDGAGHQWPGGAEQKPVGRKLIELDPPFKALDATSVIWQFFSEH
ncbi:MAG TPA: PHB depolymerase family esterase [Candidatus Saccharimonadales bacterium]|nr:PHB depolymerase family esterase [Candidatus Saccharimonadales bacterium]